MNIQDYFIKYHYISQREIAERIGINKSLLRQYVCGIKKPSNVRLKQIEAAVRAIGLELSKATIDED